MWWRKMNARLGGGLIMSEFENKDGCCRNCGARTGKGLCNNPRSPNYKQVGTTRCNEWVHKVYTPKEWEKKR